MSDFPFGPKHAWLCDAVALRLSPGEEPAVIPGRVQDGSLGDGEEAVFVSDGVEDRAALHAACWSLSGEAEWPALRDIAGRDDWRVLEPYQEQLFEFDAFQAAGLRWMAVDPTRDTAAGHRSRERMLRLLGAAR